MHHSHKSIDAKYPHPTPMGKKTSVDLTFESNKDIPPKLETIAE